MGLSWNDVRRKKNGDHTSSSIAETLLISSSCMAMVLKPVIKSSRKTSLFIYEGILRCPDQLKLQDLSVSFSSLSLIVDVVCGKNPWFRTDFGKRHRSWAFCNEIFQSSTVTYYIEIKCIKELHCLIGSIIKTLGKISVNTCTANLSFKQLPLGIRKWDTRNRLNRIMYLDKSIVIPQNVRTKLTSIFLILKVMFVNILKTYNTSLVEKVGNCSKWK